MIDAVEPPESSAAANKVTCEHRLLIHERRICNNSVAGGYVNAGVVAA